MRVGTRHDESGYAMFGHKAAKRGNSALNFEVLFHIVWFNHEQRYDFSVNSNKKQGKVLLIKKVYVILRPKFDQEEINNNIFNT